MEWTSEYTRQGNALRGYLVDSAGAQWIGSISDSVHAEPDGVRRVSMRRMPVPGEPPWVKEYEVNGLVYGWNTEDCKALAEQLMAGKSFDAAVTNLEVQRATHAAWLERKLGWLCMLCGASRESTQAEPLGASAQCGRCKGPSVVLPLDIREAIEQGLHVKRATEPAPEAATPSLQSRFQEVATALAGVAGASEYVGRWYCLACGHSAERAPSSAMGKVRECAPCQLHTELALTYGALATIVAGPDLRGCVTHDKQQG